NWAQPDYPARGWKVGQAGFGYGDNDDETVLADMHGRYTTVYCRKTFEIRNVGEVVSLVIGINYDDAVIAYLNGKEVLRLNVGQGRGAAAKRVGSHEAGGYEHFEVPEAARLLARGKNVIAFEGHNKGPKSSDFSLEPYLLVRTKADERRTEARSPAVSEIPGVKPNMRYSTTSEMLLVMNRHTGEVLWKRPATYSFRHNTVIAGGGKLFCIDRLSDDKIRYLSRRGVKFSHRPTLYALDLKSGEVRWKSDENVFGTWLGYSEQHDVLLQGGSRAGDRGYDEVGAGLVAYNATNGEVLWQRPDAYSGPPVIYHDMILTQTGGGNAVAPPAAVFNLLTGKVVTRKHPVTGATIPWNWVRFKGCNTAIASENLLTFRSGAASFVPLDISQGTASIGGFKSGCTSNLIVANGVLNAPDYTRTCICSYQQQSSLAMIHMPELEYWSMDYFPPPPAPTAAWRVGINFGAPGNRTADDGTLWLEFPSIGGPSPDIPVRPAGDGAKWFRAHNTTVEGELNWVTASGVSGVTSLKIRPFVQPTKRHNDVYGFAKHMGNIPRWDENSIQGRFDKPRPYTVRLYFSEPEGLAAGKRVFSVWMQGKQVLRDFDVAKAAGGANRSVVREFKNVMITDDLVLTFNASRGRPVICGVELVAE
ncbi:MAG: malectin domain-containing carbohydrate-binding protein, partial [Planctomycetota bacterium]